MNADNSYLNNQFLIAMPAMSDSFFARSVIFLCQHNDEGALGIVVNRPSELQLGDILEQMQIETDDANIIKLPIYFGGPVQPERGFVIHEPAGEWSSSLRISDDVALTTSRDILEAIASGQGPRNILIALGYAGWSKGQLEQEILANSWLNSTIDSGIIFDTPASQRWKAAVAAMGIDIALLSNLAGHA